MLTKTISKKIFCKCYQDQYNILKIDLFCELRELGYSLTSVD
jgi:hypothetical protein